MSVATGCSTSGLLRNVRFALADAECLPFADESFDCVTIAFGLRNVTDKPPRSHRCTAC